MDFSMPGFLVLQHLLQFAQTHVRGVCDAIQPSHPLSSPSPPAFNLSQHQSLFQWISSSPQWSNKSIGASASALVLPMYSGLISFRIDWLISLQFKALLKVFSSTTVQKLAAGLGYFPIAQSGEGAPVLSSGPCLTENLKERSVACPLGNLTPSPFVGVPFRVIKYIHMAVQPSPPSIHRTLSISQN